MTSARHSKILLQSGLTPYTVRDDEVYMCDTQLEHFRRILYAWRDRLWGEIASTRSHIQTSENSYSDPLDRSVQEADFNLELRTRDRERRLIQKIEHAVELIDRKEYGYCTCCQAAIGIRRLEARPTADKCIDCKIYEERLEKQDGR